MQNASAASRGVLLLTTYFSRSAVKFRRAGSGTRRGMPFGAASTKFRTFPSDSK